MAILETDLSLASLRNIASLKEMGKNERSRGHPGREEGTETTLVLPRVRERKKALTVLEEPHSVVYCSWYWPLSEPKGFAIIEAPSILHQSVRAANNYL